MSTINRAIVNCLTQVDQCLPDELLVDIFVKGQKSLPELSRVCKQWHRLGYSREIYEILLDKIAFLPKDWKEYYDIDCGDFFPLLSSQVPRAALISDKPRTITWIPDLIKKVVTNDEGVKEEKFSSLIKIKELEEFLLNPKKGYTNKIKYQEAVAKPEWKVEKAHWSWIDCEPIGLGEDYSIQTRLVQAKKSGADVSRARSSLISFMTKMVKFGEKCVFYIEGDSGHYLDFQGAYVVFKDKLKIIHGPTPISAVMRRISATYTSEALLIDSSRACNDNLGYFLAAVVAERKFFNS